MEIIFTVVVAIFAVAIGLYLLSVVLAAAYFAYTGLEDGMNWLFQKAFDAIGRLFRATIAGIRELCATK